MFFKFIKKIYCVLLSIVSLLKCSLFYAAVAFLASSKVSVGFHSKEFNI